VPDQGKHADRRLHAGGVGITCVLSVPDRSSALQLCTRAVIQDLWHPVTRRRKPGHTSLRREAPTATTGRTGLAFSRGRCVMSRCNACSHRVLKILWIWVHKKEVLTNS